MDDLAGQLNALLKDPDSMEMLQGLAASLFSGEEEKKQDPPPQPAAPAFPDLGGSELGLLMKVGNLLRSNHEDDRTRLLMALRPMLSPERQSRVDKAVKLLKLAELLPLLKESGLELF